MKLKQVFACVSAGVLLWTGSAFANGKVSVDIGNAFKHFGDGISRAAQDLGTHQYLKQLDFSAHVLNAVKGLGDQTSAGRFSELLWQRYKALADANGVSSAEGVIAADIRQVDTFISKLEDAQSRVEAEKVSWALKQATVTIKTYLKNSSVVDSLKQADLDFVRSLKAGYGVSASDPMGRIGSSASGKAFATVGLSGKLEIGYAGSSWINILETTIGRIQLNDGDIGNVSEIRKTYQTLSAEIRKQNATHHTALGLLADNINPDGPSGKLWLAVTIGGLKLSEVVALTKKGIPLSTVLDLQDIKTVLGSEDAAYTKFAGNIQKVLVGALGPKPVFDDNGKYHGTNGPFVDAIAARDYLFTVVDKQVAALAPTYALGKEMGGTVNMFDVVQKAFNKTAVDQGVRQEATQLLRVLAYFDQNLVHRAALEQIVFSKNLDEQTIRKVSKLESMSRACLSMK